MLGAALAVVASLVLLSPDSALAADPAALVGQLGSARFSERERADAALEEIGGAALPALRAALSARDLEVRMRAAAIVGRIEGALLVRATSIPLAFRDVRLSEALQSITNQGALSLVPATDGDPGWAGRRFTLDDGRSLPFWKAIDAVCEAGRAHYTLGNPTPPGQGPAIFPIYEGVAPPAGPFSDHGPFRVQLIGVHPLNEVEFSRSRVGPGGRVVRPRIAPDPAIPAASPSSARPFSIQLLVAAEPRLSIAPMGPVRVVEAFDEDGRSFAVPPRPPGIQHSSGYMGMAPSPFVRLRVDLGRPDGTGRRIKRVKGVIPVAVAMRKPDPLTLSLDGPAGQSARNDEILVTLREVRPARPRQPATVVLTLRNAGGPPAHGDGFEGDILPYRPDSPQQQLEVLDAEGRPISWFPKGSLYNGEETQLTLAILPGAGTGPPATIRYHGMIRGSAEIPFEFREIAIP